MSVSNQKLINRTALITGGGRGIGRAIALAFAREGAQVAVAARTAAQVEHVTEEINSEFGRQAMPVICDVADLDSVSQMFKTLAERFGGSPDILVNNAGIAESA